jgi:beta-lactamase class A
LPEGTVVAHKTGSSDTNDEGMTYAVNDIGIVVLPDGRKYSIAVFVTNSYEKNEDSEKIIADISKAAYDYFFDKSSK